MKYHEKDTSVTTSTTTTTTTQEHQLINIDQEVSTQQSGRSVVSHNLVHYIQ